MQHDLKPDLPVLRVFQARAKPGCEQALAGKLATSSVAVVQGQSGNLGHLAGLPATAGGRDFIFCSIWRDADALIARFGSDWRSSYLPAGYDELIETCSVQHYSISLDGCSFPK